MQQDAADVLDAQAARDLGREEPGGEGAPQERLDLPVEAADAELRTTKKGRRPWCVSQWRRAD